MGDKYYKSSLKNFSIAGSASATDRSKSTTSKEVQHGNTSERICACSVHDATGNCTTCRGKKGCRRAKSSTPKDFLIRFPTRQERWPAYAIAIVCLTAVIAFRIGCWLGDAAVSLVLHGEVR